MSAGHGRALEGQVDGRSARLQVREDVSGSFHVTLDERALAVDACVVGPGFLSLLIDGRSHLAGLERNGEGYLVTVGHDVFHVLLRSAAEGLNVAPHHASGPFGLKAPMPGKIVRVLVAPGAQVVEAQGLVVMEAMKMENELRSPRAGIVRALHVQEGQTVEAGQPIAVVE